MQNNSQYNIPQTFVNHNKEVQFAEALSARLDEQHAQQVAAFNARLDAQQYAKQAAIAFAAQAEAARIPEPQPVMSEPVYVSRPERNMSYAPNYEIKEVENKLDSAHETALAIEAKSHPWLKTVKSFVLAPKPPLAQMIEKEGVTGGMLINKLMAEQGMTSHVQYRFFCENHEWFLYPANDPDSAVHYQVTDTEIRKSYRGHLVPLDPGEDVTLRRLAPAYYQAVIEEHYPFEAILTELMSPEEPDVDTISRIAA